MITKNYKIAGKVIEVNSIYESVHEYCKDYITDEKADFSVTTTQKDIDFERDRSARENIVEGIPIRKFKDDYLEELAVYRQIATNMIQYDTILFHGSVIAVDGQGFLFTAKSGTGKSTHTRLWREMFGDRAVMVNDDKPLLQVTDDAVIAYGTPYNGKHHLGNNMSVKLKGICILTRAENNSITPITKSDAYAMLLQQVYRPKEKENLVRTLMLIDKIAKNTGLYRLGCNMDIEAAEVAYNGMK